MFFVFVLLILSPVLALLYLRMLPFLPKPWHKWGIALFVLLFLSTAVYRMLPSNWYWFNSGVFIISGFWLVFLSNWLLTVVLSEPVLLAIGLYKKNRKPLLQKYYARALPTIFVLSIGLFVWGFSNAQQFTVRHFTINTHKNLPKPITVAAIADVHFDYAFPLKKWNALGDTLQALQPDIVVHLGDFSDIPASALDQLNAMDHFTRYTPPLGVWGITGNHEAYMEMRNNGTIAWQSSYISLLRDSSACLTLPNDTLAVLCLTGREDVQFSTIGNTPRSALQNFAPALQKREHTPWLLLDHQPVGLQNQDLPPNTPKPDLALSGHTHAGQFFPWNIVIHWVWPLVDGLGELSGTPWIVSAGFGQWGPPARIGTSPDILFITME
jgi:uncharacterized protein